MEESGNSGPAYKLGKIANKHLIIEIIGYSINDFTLVCQYLYYCSRQMRGLVKKNYIIMRNILWKTHEFFGASLLAIRNYQTSQGAHRLLEKNLERKCEELTTFDYGLEILPETVLLIANTEKYRWLLQPELKAIKDGLTYGTYEYIDPAPMDKYYSYEGYLNE